MRPESQQEKASLILGWPQGSAVFFHNILWAFLVSPTFYLSVLSIFYIVIARSAIQEIHTGIPCWWKAFSSCTMDRMAVVPTVEGHCGLTWCCRSCLGKTQLSSLSLWSVNLNMCGYWGWHCKLTKSGLHLWWSSLRDFLLPKCYKSRYLITREKKLTSCYPVNQINLATDVYSKIFTFLYF